jgi:hypothetical protein
MLPAQPPESPAEARHDVRPAKAGPYVHPGWLCLAGGLTLIVLVATVSNQLYDTNYYALFEATSLLAGDRPYKDFYNWGAPLPAYLSAFGQIVSGNRLIGEFAMQWFCITTGAVLSFYMGLRLSGSLAASMVTFLVSLLILVGTPTEHYPKLIVYPLALWLIWRYLDAPSVRRIAIVGVMSTVAFLLRHDHLLDVASAAVLAIVLARLAMPAWRNTRAFLIEGISFAAAALVSVTPWLVLVQAGEGVPEYVRQRFALYENWSVKASPFAALLALDPVATFVPEKRPPPKAATVTFRWGSDIGETRRHELEAQCNLRPLAGPDDGNRWTYVVADIYDTRLLALTRSIDEANGFDRQRLETLATPFPTRDRAVMWLLQVTLLVPLLLIGSVAIDVLRSWRGGPAVTGPFAHALVAAVLLILAVHHVLLQPSYFAALAPLTAAMGARLLVWRHRSWAPVRIALGSAMVVGSAVAGLSFGQLAAEPFEAVAGLPSAFSRLLASPPIDGVLPADRVAGYTREMWDRDNSGQIPLMLRYLHDCSAPGDRLLITGSTPSHVNYLANRPFAGGHVLWHHRWRADHAGEAQSLALLQQQSVPFVFSSTDPVLDDFKYYPAIRRYLVDNYVEIEGAKGLLLVDARRAPRGQFGQLGFPCFR